MSAEFDAENSLRTAVLEFMDTVRGVEQAVAAARRGGDVPEELDSEPLTQITEEEWRAHWPSEVSDEAEAEIPAESAEEPASEEPAEDPR